MKSPSISLNTNIAIKKIILLLLICSSIHTTLTAQYKYQVKSRKADGLADYIRPFNFTGWYVSPGLTFMPKLNFIPFEPTTELTTNAGRYETIDLEQKSKTGLYIEAGRYKLLSSKKLISYIDFGLAYKQLKGLQSYGLSYIPNAYDTNLISYHEQSFSLHNVALHFNANNVIGINKNFFIQNTLGVNVDYSVYRTIKTTDDTPFMVETYQENPSKLWAQIHYKFGLGFRFSELIYVIPSIETPVLNAWKFEGGRSTIGFFNSRYRPVILSVRIAFLTKPSCPKTDDGQGSKNDGGAPRAF